MPKPENKASSQPAAGGDGTCWVRSGTQPEPLSALWPKLLQTHLQICAPQLPEALLLLRLHLQPGWGHTGGSGVVVSGRVSAGERRHSFGQHPPFD